MERSDQLGNKKRIPLFFIMGRPRSGTTLLRTLFDAHPNVMIGLECPFILPLFDVYGNKTSWTEQELQSFYNDLLQQSFWDYYNFKDLKIDFENLKADILNCIGECSFNALIKLVFSNYISDFPKTEILAYGDKNPHYSIKFNKLFSVFPDAKYIYITRDYRDQLLSVKNAGFGKKGRKDSRILNLWRKSYLDISKVRNENPDLFYSLRYEDFVLNPESYFSEMCNFLEIPYCPEVFDFYKHKDEVGFYPEEIMKKYQKSLFNPIDASRVNVWKQKMTEKEIRLADTIVGDVAEMAGYERKYTKEDPIIKGRFLFQMKVINPIKRFLSNK
ncbi:MAG: sulfotransferase [Bacteroidales bacterium]